MHRYFKKFCSFLSRFISKTGQSVLEYLLVYGAMVALILGGIKLINPVTIPPGGECSPVDAVWSPWTACICDVECEEGTCSQSRSCMPPSCGGKTCAEMDPSGLGTSQTIPCDAGACNDSVSCTIDSCSMGTCDYAPNDTLCDDGDLCTTDTCDASLDCQHPPISCPVSYECDSATGSCVPIVCNSNGTCGDISYENCSNCDDCACTGGDGVTFQDACGGGGTPNVCGHPTAGFSAVLQKNAGAGKMEVVFTNTSSNATSYQWDFYNATNTFVEATSTAKNPTYSFAEVGTHNVTLTAYHSSGAFQAVTNSVTFSLGLPQLLPAPGSTLLLNQSYAFRIQTSFFTPAELGAVTMVFSNPSAGSPQTGNPIPHTFTNFPFASVAVTINKYGLQQQIYGSYTIMPAFCNNDTHCDAIFYESCLNCPGDCGCLPSQTCNSYTGVCE